MFDGVPHSPDEVSLQTNNTLDDLLFGILGRSEKKYMFYVTIRKSKIPKIEYI